MDGRAGDSSFTPASSAPALRHGNKGRHQISHILGTFMLPFETLTEGFLEMEVAE